MITFDPQKTADDLVTFLKTSFIHAGFSKAVIALSGGVDSATSCALVVRALGADHVYPLFLPYGELNRQGVVDAQEVAKTLQIPKEHMSIVDIQSLTDKLLTLDPTMDNIRKGNVMARVRMIVLFDAAKKQQALVVGTENKSEHLLGYFTRFGDEASDIEPLRNLYKTQVYILAKYLGIPEAILTKAPTAGLWEGQTDEEELGFSYKDADKILSLLYDEKKSKEKVTEAGFSLDLIEKVTRQVEKNNFKHALPIIPQ